MDLIETYIILLGIIALVGWIFKRVSIPLPLILVVVGMILGFLPFFPEVTLKPELVLDIFLPLLIYLTTAQSSWRDVRNNINPIISLSIGHVLFIATLIAFTVHSFFPELGWPIAFILGAVIAPPDDVAIIAIAEKIKMPNRIVTILKGEGMLNDVVALILFRFALAAALTHQFSAVEAFWSFIVIVLGEIAYGLVLGHLIGEMRLRIKDPTLHVLVSIITPFLAYLPPERLGGSGILATAVTGFVIGYQYLERFTPEVRIISRSVWLMIEFTLQSILFLLVGLNLRLILTRISPIPTFTLLSYSAGIILIVILGRFAWIYGSLLFPRYLPYVKRSIAYPWQGLFVVSWAGMRGSISLAAALAVPLLPNMIEGVNARDLIIFLVFSVIVATLLVQGMTLPWLLKILKIKERGEREHYTEHLQELAVRLKLTKTVLRWLKEYREEMEEDKNLCDELNLHAQQYKILKRQLKEQIAQHEKQTTCSVAHDVKIEFKNSILISTQIIEIERSKLLELWQKNKISYTVKNKLTQQLDFLSKHLT